MRPFLQVHPAVQVLFIHDVSIFQDDNAPVHTGKWIHEQQEQVKCLSCPPESPHLNITEPLEKHICTVGRLKLLQKRFKEVQDFS